MLRYVGTRFLRTLSVVLAVTFMTFVLLNLLPGSPINAILGPAAGDPTARAQLTHQLGLNHPLVFRYFIWLGNALHGNLGQSYISGETVSSTIVQHLPLTFELIIISEIMSLGFAIPVALYCALHPGGWFDGWVSRVSLALLALPAFVLGELLIFIFSVKTHLFPASGYVQWFTLGNPQSPSIIATPLSIIMPSFTLAAGQLAVFTRVLRGDLLTTLKSQFITMARSKGFSSRRILLTHALRPSSFSLMSLVGLSIGGLLAGAVIVEQIFALPGMGSLLVTSIEKRDYLMVQGIVVLISTGFVTVNFITDALYGVLDPRVRRGRLLAA